VCAAADIFKLFQLELEKLGLNWLSYSELIGIDTDGEASLIGVENGFVQKVYQILSHVINIQLHCPQKNLSVLSAVKNVKCIDDTDSILKHLYKFYHPSARRINQLRSV
jgi:hypothetical protein